MSESVNNSAPSAPAAPVAPAAPAPAPSEPKAPAAPAEGEPKPNADSPPSEAIKLKLKIRGQEREEVLDRDRLTQLVQQGVDSGMKYQEAKALAKQVQEREKAHRERLKADPWAVLQEEGLDPRQLSEAYLSKLLERELASPEARALADAQEKLAALEAEREEQRAQAEAAQFDAETQRYVQEYQAKIEKCLAPGVPGVPNCPETIQRIGYYLHEGLARGEELEPEDVLPLLKEDYQGIVQSVVANLDGPGLVALLGDKVVDTLRRFEVEKLKGNRQPPAPAPTSPSPRQPERPKLSPSEWLEEIRRRTG